MEIIYCVLALILGLASLQEKRFINRLKMIACMHVPLGFLGYQVLSSHRVILFIAGLSQIALLALLFDLVRECERSLGSPIVIGRIRGLSALFPEVSGLVLSSILFCLWCPGTLCFFLIDVFLHESLHDGVGLVLSLSFLSLGLILSASLYQAYTELFYGVRMGDEVASRLPLKKLKWYRLLLTMSCLLGLAPNALAYLLRLKL